MAGENPNAPKYVVIAMVEQGGFGAEAAAPIARHVIEDIYHRRTTIRAAAPWVTADGHGGGARLG